MELQWLHRMPGGRLLWTDGESAYFARGMSYYRVDNGGKRLGRVVRVGSILEYLLSLFRLPRQLLRGGIHHLWPLQDGAALVVVRKRAYFVNATGRAALALRFPRGNKPAHKGVCVTPHGEVFLGEYALNFERKMPVTLYRSRDGGRTFAAIFEFAPGEVRHIHFLQWDPYTNCLWLGTGDADSECWIYRSQDGETWEKVGGGSQLWRAVGVSFRPEALFWGTDAGSDAGEHPNYVMRLDRTTLALTKVLEIQGPCHGNATLKDGTLLVSTGVEGGVNEKDHCAHLWASRDGDTWQEVVHFKKDRWPYLLQYGVIRFPQGLEQSDRIAFTCLGLAGCGETVLVANLRPAKADLVMTNQP